MGDVQPTAVVIVPLEQYNRMERQLRANEQLEKLLNDPDGWESVGQALANYLEPARAYELGHLSWAMKRALEDLAADVEVRRG